MKRARSPSRLKPKRALPAASQGRGHASKSKSTSKLNSTRKRSARVTTLEDIEERALAHALLSRRPQGRPRVLGQGAQTRHQTKRLALAQERLRGGEVRGCGKFGCFYVPVLPLGAYVVPDSTQGHVELLQVRDAEEALELQVHCCGSAPLRSTGTDVSASASASADELMGCKLGAFDELKREYARSRRIKDVDPDEAFGIYARGVAQLDLAFQTDASVLAAASARLPRPTDGSRVDGVLISAFGGTALSGVLHPESYNSGRLAKPAAHAPAPTQTLLGAPRLRSPPRLLSLSALAERERVAHIPRPSLSGALSSAFGGTSASAPSTARSTPWLVLDDADEEDEDEDEDARGRGRGRGLGLDLGLDSLRVRLNGARDGHGPADDDITFSINENETEHDVSARGTKRARMLQLSPVFTEAVQHGDVADEALVHALDDPARALHADEARTGLSNLWTGLAHMHAAHLCHGDLHLSNVVRGARGWRFIDFADVPAQGTSGLWQMQFKDVHALQSITELCVEHLRKARALKPTAPLTKVDASFVWAPPRTETYAATALAYFDAALL